MKRYFCLSLVLIGLSSCSNFWMYYPNYEGMRPKHFHFRLKDKPLPSNAYEIIDTNAVYIDKGFYDDLNKDTLFTAIRFFSNGRYYNSPLTTSKNLIGAYNQVDSSGFLGYFVIEKGMIKGEAFMGGQYITQKFKIVENGIVEISAQIRRYFIMGGAFVPVQGVYIKHYPPNLQSKPNW